MIMEWLSAYLLMVCLTKSFIRLDATQTIQLEPGTTGTYAAGIVQVLHNNEWGTVCHDWWGTDDTKVACRQLGFTKSLGPSYYGQGKGKVWLYGMACSGSEASLQSCSHNGWENVPSGCNGHTIDAGVVCDGYTGSGSSTIRLIHDTRLPSGTPTKGTGGIVRVFHNNQWGTVCNDDWDMYDAKVACRQLGFTKTVGYWYYGQGTGKVWLYNMQCSGSETSLGSCSQNGWGSVNSNCNTHKYDAGVVCSDYQGRGFLTQIRIAGEGRIEIKYAYDGNSWGSICDNDFGLNEANVVCRMMEGKYGIVMGRRPNIHEFAII